jgi:hypothetical protein
MRLAAYLRLKFLSAVRFSVFLAIFRGYSFRRFVLAPLRLGVRFSSRLFLRFFSLSANERRGSTEAARPSSPPAVFRGALSSVSIRWSRGGRKGTFAGL